MKCKNKNNKVHKINMNWKYKMCTEKIENYAKNFERRKSLLM